VIHKIHSWKVLNCGEEYCGAIADRIPMEDMFWQTV
jgi:hypothetical protein